MESQRDVLKLIGNTPLVKLRGITEGLGCDIYAKLESYNPSGSLKDRVALYIIDDAERRGILRPGDLIVEATSGNMGTAFALVGAIKGYRCVFTLPETISREKIGALRLLGAEVILTPKGLPPQDDRSCYKVAQRIARERGGFYVNQYFNPLNPEAHYRTTGPEIWRDTGGRIDVVVCGIGTGGTITGVGRYLKERREGIKVIGVEPKGSVFMSYLKEGVLKRASDFNVEGIGKNFIPGVIDFRYIDDVIQVDDSESFKMVDRLIKKEGILAGGSSGAAVTAALRYAESNEKDECIVTILPDTGLKYLSKLVALDSYVDHNPHG
ncbi:MAG TPA: cysteine synthase family protein [Thermodesulfobacteriota bacterium]|nr:cysteine synthase family protein [Thermodesulfobacteriota bacterium]